MLVKVVVRATGSKHEAFDGLKCKAAKRDTEPIRRLRTPRNLSWINRVGENS